MFLEQIFINAWTLLLAMSPYLLLGLALSGMAFALLPQGIVKERLGGSGIAPVLRGALYGIPMPLCSCSTLPMALSMRRQGASIGAVGSFLISTPQTGVDSFIVTWSMLGPVFAVFRPLSAFLSGVFGGMCLDLFAKRSPVPKDAVKEEASACGCSCGSGCSTSTHDASSKGRFRRIIQFAFSEMPEEIGPSLLVGILIGGVIQAVFPSSVIEGFLGPGPLGLFAALFIGIPMYVCATASVPIGVALLMKGASPGAVFVFLMAGPATNTASMSAIYSTFGARNLFVYLATVAVCALFFGYVLDLIPMDLAGIKALGVHEFFPEWVQKICAFLLLALIFKAFYGKMGASTCT